MNENRPGYDNAALVHLARRFTVFCLFEEVLFACLLCCAYTSHPDRTSPQNVLVIVLALFACATAANVALYFENRGLCWQELRRWRKGFNVLAAIMTTSASFCMGFAFLGLLSGVEMGPISLLTLSGMAGLSFGPIGLAGFYLATGVRSKEDCLGARRA